MHHVVSDGWSIGILLVQEITVLYAAFLEGRACPLEPLPIQYSDYAAWQRDWLQGEALDSQLAFWKSALCGRPLTLSSWPTDRPRPPVQTFRGATITRNLPAEVKRARRRSSRKQQRRDGVHGPTRRLRRSPLAVLPVRTASSWEAPSRTARARETEGLIGFFVNTLAIPVRIDREISFLRSRAICQGKPL